MKTRRYSTLIHGRRITIWRQICTPRPWWKRVLEALDRVFWP
jgi:hypothetical protein